MPDDLRFTDIALFMQQFKARIQKAPQTGAVRLSQV